ncbi:S41 family peptidase [Aliifodinibius sp. S!AR15-10]|uniref:S41 family peptidase n=1 Tax=Aliifodinibius sp. S!AR15-10 TaxID=2950437 RepID=UPI00285B13AB|nr:S41 family peptidase [Aliifodinibius sp. S!AR15-10]MDR8390840.1 S41 family peptidase [Aliifodinibius sp. S!AR15-10]
MSIKKFIAPHAAILVVLSLFWAAGVDSVIQPDDTHQENLKKYIQTQRRIVDNYVEKVDIAKLYRNSIRGLVKNLTDSTLNIDGTPLDTTALSSVNIEDLGQSLRKFEDAYLYLANNSPDENMTARTEDALRQMFKSLDPHSVYIEPETNEQVQEEFAGKFQGIGIQFNIPQDTITVITAISGGPSDKLGIRSGDRIIKINGKSAIGFENKDVLRSLRGEKGTKVDVTIKRPHIEEPLNFTITRDDIPLYTVDTSYMLDEETGYIKINRFAATTHEEFMEAMKSLDDKGMKRLVLDLRSNPGGYLGQAIAMAEEFFPKGTELVSTKSRHTRFTSSYSSRRDGYFKDKPLIVLVNEGSASASEIVSGAIQDHDRGLIVGQRTFGKGLVQQQYELVDSSSIRVTISRYYTPSGRLIQKPYSKSGREAYAYEVVHRSDDAFTDKMEFISDVPDSLKFNTDAGRTVYGGGGIVPDHIVQEDTTQSAAVVNFMRRKQVGFDFVRNYLDHNGNAFREQWEENYDLFREEFTWSEAQIDEFKKDMINNNLVIKKGISEPEFKSDSLFIPEGHFEEIEWMPRGFMKAELARQVWGLKAYHPVINDVFDDVLKKATDLWDEVQALEEYAANHTRMRESG